MKKKTKAQLLGIAACIFFLGAICLVIPGIHKSGENQADASRQLTAAEKENLEHFWIEQRVTSALKYFNESPDYKVAIDWSEGEITGVSVTVSAGGTGQDALKADVAGCGSKTLGISAESVVIFFV